MTLFGGSRPDPSCMGRRSVQLPTFRDINGLGRKVLGKHLRVLLELILLVTILCSHDEARRRGARRREGGRSDATSRDHVPGEPRPPGSSRCHPRARGAGAAGAAGTLGWRPGGRTRGWDAPGGGRDGLPRSRARGRLRRGRGDGAAGRRPRGGPGADPRGVGDRRARRSRSASGDACDLDPALLAAILGPDGLGGQALSPVFGQDAGGRRAAPRPGAGRPHRAGRRRPRRCCPMTS